MNIIIYEDEGYKNFLPLTWTRPVYGLRCGINTLAEKIIRQYPKAKVEYGCRYYLPGNKLMKFTRGLFINGRVLAKTGFAKEIPLKGPDQIFIAGDEIVAIRATSNSFEEVRKKAKKKRVRTRVFEYPWELVQENGRQIIEDRKYFKIKKRGRIHNSVVIYNSRDVIIGEGVEVGANTVIDARSGPVYIGKGAIVRPLSYLKGPLSIGPMCRVGGEVSTSIFHGHSNKQHYGFIGGSYLGEWVNLGAGTTNSNLKNNYGSVKVLVDGKKIDSGERYVGCFIGDHAKTGIGTLITTGAVIGVAANIFAGGVTPKAVSSFSWGGKAKYSIEKAVEAMKMVMKRRNRAFSSEDERLIRYLHKHSS